MIINSGATQAIFHRSPSDLMCLGKLLEMKSDLVYKSISENMGMCLKKCGLRKTYKGGMQLASRDEIEELHEKVKRLKTE